MYSHDIGKRQFRFEKIDVNDYIKFKALKKEEKETYNVYFAKVKDVSRKGYVGVEVFPKDNNFDYPIGLTIHIDRRAVLQIYPSKIIKHLTPRIALKHLWKDLIFREVKTTKYNRLLYAEYKYINKTGFERVKRFSSLEEAYNNVSPEYHRNIVPYYEDFFGFTTNKAIRDNDNHYDREIFFSKKCYSELDWCDNNPTGDFMVNERGFNSIPVIADDLICGIVENGEKGLFFRKWFVCSKEFLTLWTMVCEPNNPSLLETENNFDINNFQKGEWVKKVTKKDKKIKSLDKLLKELDTSKYSVNLNLNLEERRKKHKSYNLERAALFYPNRYKKIAEVLFYNGSVSQEEGSYCEDSDFSNFQKKLLRNILWPRLFC